MFYTLTEAANKYQVDAFQFSQFLLENHHNVMLDNPDISASGTDACLISDDKLYGTMAKFLTKDVALPTNDQIQQLEKTAVHAMALYLATRNVASSFDFNMDMRLEHGSELHQTPPADFMADLDCTKDMLADMDNDIHAEMVKIQNKLAADL